MAPPMHVGVLLSVVPLMEFRRVYLPQRGSSCGRKAAADAEEFRGEETVFGYKAAKHGLGKTPGQSR